MGEKELSAMDGSFFFMKGVQNMDINNMGILEYMTITEFKRKMIMDRYELGAATKEDTIKKLEMLDNIVQEGLVTMLKASGILPDSDDQKE